ncbi:SWI/SNF-related matrix-associated actin-dependent regulator of chromatin subfamily A-like protein 1 isoform X1 [Solanum tuberosum]|uniref:SWI/SNF-related matrix-associated actin-dependent regulator of chromatin subfamily A-like protein 1 isoform X1 n=1 Tax=Solanum tuberosum TaxID=4113 RepID=UPI0003D28125|nr:PREDICTED: SWI/SNF-related matrix-associated actin-dependent regulator of chromatin subfamily A-like protein 1 isoform X1 [Solanum tuberosum]
MDFDDWELSAEELDKLERDALRQIAERNASSSSATTSSCLQSTVSSRLQGDVNCSGVSYKREDVLSAAPIIRPSSGYDKVSGKSSVGNSGPHNDNHVKQLTEKRSVKFFLHASGNIAAKFSYDQILVEACRKIPKASWSAKERLWMFPLSSLSVAEKVLHEISGSNLELENLDPLVQRAIAAASVMPDLQDHYEFIPNSIETKLLPFQREGVRFALQHGGRILLADEMGLGKTLQAIAVVSCVRESWPVLVLAPSALRLHWASMIQQWMNIPSSEILVVLSQCSGSNKGGFKIVPSNTKKSIHLDGVFNIVSYDTVSKLQDLLMASTFKVVIADESHFLKNAQAKRTSASLPLLQKAQYVILLSGTPALSRPIELFKQLEALHPTVYKNVHEYGNRYCKGGIFGVYQGASNHEELHSLIKATVMIRRLKKDVLSELPQKRRQQVFLNLGEKEMRQVNALFRELEVIKGKRKSAQSEEEANSLKFAEKSLISKIYTASAEAKIPAVLDYLGTMVEANCKFLIFAHHQSMIDSIHEYLLKKKVGCIRIDGSTPSALRQDLVTDFQEKETIKAAVLSIRAGGVGLTLTAASTVIFAELSWTPGDLIQAEDRAHRIGQVSSVNVCYLLANDTVDDIIWDVVQSKLDNLGQMLDGQEKSLEVSTNQSHSSPSKQKTLDSFIKRCNNSPQDPSKKHCRD